MIENMHLSALRFCHCEEHKRTVLSCFLRDVATLVPLWDPNAAVRLLTCTCMQVQVSLRSQ